jgi:hypothetical protein
LTLTSFVSPISAARVVLGKPGEGGFENGLLGTEVIVRGQRLAEVE